MNDNLIPVAENVDPTSAKSIYNTNRRITHKINGGFNQLQDRLKAYISALSIMGCFKAPVKNDTKEGHISSYLEKLKAVETKPKDPQVKNSALSSHEAVKERVARAGKAASHHSDKKQPAHRHHSHDPHHDGHSHHHNAHHPHHEKHSAHHHSHHHRHQLS